MRPLAGALLDPGISPARRLSVESAISRLYDSYGWCLLAAAADDPGDDPLVALGKTATFRRLQGDVHGAEREFALDIARSRAADTFGPTNALHMRALTGLAALVEALGLHRPAPGASSTS
jgi:hypothetical protein